MAKKMVVILFTSLLVLACAGNMKLLQAKRMKPNTIVAKDGSGDYRTVNEAINSMIVQKGRYVIYVKTGVYEEIITVPLGNYNLFMYGDGPEKTIITGHRSNMTNYTTIDSATFAVEAENFTAKYMGFRNTAGRDEKQAVAFRFNGNFGAFYKCSFDGFQDTLWVQRGLQFFRNCIISGTVDFIFGDSRAVFQNCNIYLKAPEDGQQNIVTASGRESMKDPAGIVIQNCRIKAARGLNITKTASYLGRPWKKYSRVVVMESFIDSLIHPDGWLSWNGNFAPTLYFAEYANTGPGSSTADRVTWPGFHKISKREALSFTSGSFIDARSWMPQRKIPYYPGLTKRNQVTEAKRNNN